MEALSEFTGRVSALKNVKEVQLDSIPNLEKCVLLTAFKCVESARVTNASLLGDMKQLKNVGERKVAPPAPRKTGLIQTKSDWDALNATLTVIEIGNDCCNDDDWKELTLAVSTA